MDWKKGEKTGVDETKDGNWEALKLKQKKV